VQVGPDGSVWVAGWARVDGSEHAVVYRYADGSWQPLTSGLEQSVNGNALTVVSKNEASGPERRSRSLRRHPVEAGGRTAPKLTGQQYDVTLPKGRPVALGERFEIAGNLITAKPLQARAFWVRRDEPADHRG
jgi:hypothetical protein